jgi:hypothetical protein
LTGERRIVKNSATWIVSFVMAAACGTDPAPEPNAADFRCRSSNSDGSCNSMPANCPVTIPHGNEPGCPIGTTLISIEEDDCAHKFICID